MALAFTMIMEHAPGILLSFGGEVINLSRYNLRSLFDSRIPQPTNSHKLLIRGSSHMFEDAEVTKKKKSIEKCIKCGRMRTGVFNHS